MPVPTHHDKKAKQRATAAKNLIWRSRRSGLADLGRRLVRESAEATSAEVRVPKKHLARFLGISRQSLYYQPKLTAKDDALRNEILSLLSYHPDYGSRRIATALQCNRKRVQRVMRKFGLSQRFW